MEEFRRRLLEKKPTSEEERLMRAIAPGALAFLCLILVASTWFDDSASHLEMHRNEAFAPCSHAAGRGHRVWLRAGSVADDSRQHHHSSTGGSFISRAALDAATDGMHNLITAFGTDTFKPGRGGRRPTLRRDSPYFTAVRRHDVHVTDQCGRPLRWDGRIDVVFTYVDPEVPGWQDTMKAHHREWFSRPKFDEFGRFRQHGELNYAVRGVARHAGHMVRRIIFVVEDARHVQRALDNVTHGLAASAGIELLVISHAQMFPDVSVLPAYNSNAIEANLHRIPGLTPFFLYFNDDSLLGRRLSWFDLVRPQVMSLPKDWNLTQIDGDGATAAAVMNSRDDAGDDLQRLAPLNESLGGAGFAASALFRPEEAADGTRRLAVFIEAEMVPYMEYQLPHVEMHNFNFTASLSMNSSFANPEVARTCGPLKLNKPDDEPPMVPDRSTGLHGFLQCLRRNREHAWNYFGVHANFHDTHKGHFGDKRLLSLMLDGDAGSNPQPPLLPRALVANTRASRFRRVSDLRSFMLSMWLVIAENRRRRQQLLANNGYAAALAEVLQCVECRSGRMRGPCEHDFVPIPRSAQPMLGPRPHRMTQRRLFASVVETRPVGDDYAFVPANGVETVEQFVEDLWDTPRLWVTINDNFNSKTNELIEDEREAMTRLLRVVTWDEGCCDVAAKKPKKKKKVDDAAKEATGK